MQRIKDLLGTRKNKSPLEEVKVLWNKFEENITDEKSKNNRKIF